MERKQNKKQVSKLQQKNVGKEQIAISLKTLAGLLDAHRSSVRRWLHQAGIRPIALGKGRNSAIRYRWPEVKAWLESLEGSD